MSSVADDSSIADSVSSIGQEEWEKIARDDDSDIAEHEAIPRRSTPHVDAHHLRETVMVYPTSDMDRSTGDARPAEEEEEAEEADKEQEEDGEDELVEVVRPGSGEDGNATDSIVSHWHGIGDFQINFADRSHTNQSADTQEAVFPLAKISGSIATSYLANTQWKDLDHVAGVVRMKLGEKVLRLSRPFKLFYFGDGSLQGALEAKVGSALVAGRHDYELAHQRRRYSVLPVSWDKESPQVELMPDSGANMDVETCVTASQTSDSNRGEIEVIFQSGQTVSSWRKGKVPSFATTEGYQLPDLAIIHINDNDDDRFGATSAHIQRFLHRHKVPTLLVSSAEPWQLLQQSLIVDTDLPYLALQVPGASQAGSDVFEQLPIDVDTFLRLNSLQLNRNLAGVVSNMARDEQAKAKLSRGGRAKSHNGLLPSFLTGIKSATAFVLLLCVINLSLMSLFKANYTATGTTSQRTSPLDAKATKEQPTASKSTHTLILSDFVELTTTATTTPSPTPVVTPLPFGKELIAHVSSTERDPAMLKKFEAELYGDSVVIVRPPKWFAALRRAPELTFHVDKDGKSVKHNVTHLGEKVYALSLPREHAHGIVDVHIRCAKWPKADQTIQLDLGSAWAKLLDWLKATSELASGSSKSTSKPQNTSSKTSLSHLLSSEVWTKASIAKQSLTASLLGHLDDLRRMCQARLNETARVAGKQQQLEKFGAKMKGAGAAIEETIVVMGREITLWRQTHFREEQKNLMKIWWRLSGKAAARGEEEAVQRWTPWSRAHERKGKKT